MNRVFILTFAAVLAACAGKKTTETGPKLSARVSCNFDSFTTQDLGADALKTCDVDTDKGYAIDIEIDTDDGTQKDDPAPSTTEPTFPAQALTVTVTVNGQPVSPAPTFTPTSSFESTENKSNTITLPATSKGQSVAIHAQTQDSRGLKSNPVDITFTLN